MYDKPYEDLVKREYSEKQFTDFLDQASSVLDSIVNFGSHLFKWSKEVEKMPSDEKLVLLLMLRRALELLDSISILIKTSSVDSSKILTRALLELLLEIAYMIKDKSNQRARNYVVWYINEQLKFMENYETDSPHQKEFLRRIKADKYLNKMEPPYSESTGKIIGALQAILSDYAIENDEYQRTRSKRNKFPWYYMFNGPTNIEQLASSVDLPGFYEIYFKYFSYTTHSKDIFEGVVKESESSEALNIIQIRAPKNLQFVLSITISISLEMFSIVIDHFFPKSKVARPEFQKWYEARIKPFYWSIPRIKFT